MLERTRHYNTAGKDDLTPRQREVLKLVAAGKTNPEIAEQLGITLDGAKFHVREILAKLEVESREEAAEWWRAERALGKRIASFLRALAPAGWLKPAAAATAIGGTTLGLVAVGFAMNGGSASTAPGCELSDLRIEANSEPPAGNSSQFALTMWANRDCHLEGNLFASLNPPDPNLGLDWSVATPGRLASNGGAVALDLDSGPQRVATVVWSNWCRALPQGTFLQFDFALADPGADEDLGAATSTDGLVQPACLDANRAAALVLFVDGATETVPSCDLLALEWTHTAVLDAARGLRFTWAVESASKCLLDTTVQVGMTSRGGTATSRTPVGQPIDVKLQQVLGVGSNPVIVGALSNVCGADLWAYLVMNSTSWSDLDVPVPPCEDPARPAEFSALWTGTVSSTFPVAVEVTPFPFLGEPTKTYTVKAGDTLSSIARSFGDTPLRILLINPGLDGTNLVVGQEIQVPGEASPSLPPLPPPPPGTPTSEEQLCSLAGCLIAADALQDVDAWLGLATGRALAPGGPPELYLVDHGVRSRISPEEFRALAKANLGANARLVAIGDPRKNGVLDFVFEGNVGAIVSIAVEPGPNASYPPIGITLWDALPADGVQAETSFGSATYQRVP